MNPAKSIDELKAEVERLHQDAVSRIKALPVGQPTHQSITDALDRLFRSYADLKDALDDADK